MREVINLSSKKDFRKSMLFLVFRKLLWKVFTGKTDKQNLTDKALRKQRDPEYLTRKCKTLPGQAGVMRSRRGPSVSGNSIGIVREKFIKIDVVAEEVKVVGAEDIGFAIFVAGRE